MCSGKIIFTIHEKKIPKVEMMIQRNRDVLTHKNCLMRGLNVQ